MATLIVFASSLLMASVLVLIKYMELRNGTKNIILKFISQLDSKCNMLVHNLKFRILQLIQSIRYIVLVQSKVISRDLFLKVEGKIIKKYKAQRDAIIMGHKQIAGNGSASFYLKKITEHKGNGEKGKIE